MKQVRLIFWLLVLGFMGLLFYQNRDYLLVKNSLGIDLWFAQYTIPEVPNGLYFLGCFLIGLLLAYFYQLPERFRSAKTIKNLNAAISTLKAEAAARGRGAARETAAAPPSGTLPSDTGSGGEPPGGAATDIPGPPPSAAAPEPKDI